MSRAPSSQWESYPRSLLAVVAALLLLLGLAYSFGIPLVGQLVANRIPDSVTEQISAGVLGGLERSVLGPSTLSQDEQKRIASAFDRLTSGTRRGRYRLLFRDSTSLGANAMALPSGSIILTDALVRLAHDDREILAALAHEAGHVEARHGLRVVVQGSVLTLAIGWLVGDFTSVMTIAPAALLQARYSRGFEREADEYAANLLLSHGIPPAFLADMLERIDSWERSGRRPIGNTESDSSREGGEASGAARVSGGGLFDYAASHPATRERLDYLRNRK